MLQGAGGATCRRLGVEEILMNYCLVPGSGCFILLVAQDYIDLMMVSLFSFLVTLLSLGCSCHWNLGFINKV